VTMSTDRGPGARRRYLGKILRAIRDEAKLTVTEVAKRLDVNQSTLTRIEGGKHPTQAKHIYRLIEIYGVADAQAAALTTLAEQSNERGWWESYADALNEWFTVFAALEPDAEEIWTWEIALVPGQAQTREYARAVTVTSHPDWPEARIRRAVDLRIARQEQVDRSRLTLVVDESVVRRVVGGRDVMRAQLDSLVVAAGDEVTDLRIVPFQIGACPGMTNAFTLLRFPETEEMDLVYSETERGASYDERPDVVARYSDVFRRTRDLAISGSAVIEFLTTIRDAM
jgi:transcriptional regulator with XRE-family HTH domain